VFFRADSWPQAVTMLRAMIGLGAAESAEFHVDLYADRLVLLADGVVVAAGTARDVLTEEILSRFYRARVRIVEGVDGPLVVPYRGNPSGQ
jgi:ABC-type cobalamin/Fe3+-siderophores transport system ATPase subunit